MQFFFEHQSVLGFSMLGSACLLDIGPGLKSQVVKELHVQDCLLPKKTQPPNTRIRHYLGNPANPGALHARLPQQWQETIVDTSQLTVVAPLQFKLIVLCLEALLIKQLSPIVR